MNSLSLSALVALIFLFFITSCQNENGIKPAIGETSAVFNPAITYGSMTDQDGNVYKTVRICDQVWMAENLRTTKCRNGDPIPEVTDGEEWFELTSGAYCAYGNTNNPDSIATFGLLYNWEAITDQRNIAPAGWHVPSLEEWEILEGCLGDSVAGNKLKETGTIHWNPPNHGATNESGFTALGGGYRSRYGSVNDYFHRGIEGGWWTSTEDGVDTGIAYHATLGYNYSIIGGCNCPKIGGYSVRCVKD